MGQRILAGLLLFVVTAYAPFAAASLITKHGDIAQLKGYAIVVLISMILGTLLSAALTKTSLILAPAIGMATIYADACAPVLHGQPFMIPEQFVISAILAGLVCLYFSYKRFPLGGNKIDPNRSYRRYIIENIPSEVRQGVRAGVATLLSVTAADTVSKDKPYQVLFFCFIVAALLTLDFVAKQPYTGDGWRVRDKSLWFASWKSSEFLIPVAIFLYLTLAYRPEAIAVASTVPPWAHIDISNLYAISPADHVTHIVAIAIVLSAILIIDIPGTPWQIFADVRRPGAANVPTIESAVERSFKADSLMAIVNGLATISPSIYYAENHVLVDQAETIISSKTPAVVAAIGYVALIIVLIELPPTPVDRIKEWSEIAIAPVLFVIGLRMTARALLSDHERSAPSPTPAATPAPSPGQNTANAASQPEEVSYFYYFPIAVTIIVTHLVTIEYGITAGVLSYIAYCLVNRRPISPVVTALGLTLGFILILQLSLFVSRTP